MHASYMPKRARIVTRLHSFELYEWAKRINWDAVDKVIVVSQAMRRYFLEQYPDCVDKMEVVYNGVSVDRYGGALERDCEWNVGMLCNLSPIKRVYEVILMMHDLRVDGHQPHLHIAGGPKGDYRYTAAIHRMVKELGLEQSVTFYGYVGDTPSWLGKIDIFVSNSFWEGQPVALLEAMAGGCYCLAHVWGGAEEVLPLRNLYRTDSELKEKIVEYCELPRDEQHRQRAELREIGRLKFDIERTKREIREVIEAARGVA